ncbi:outer membrane receptor protein involved in Fe transport [Phenylobacterium haematophilum]|uniref:Outer membrane receptor protein involved in Fe transport n=1 Tax=Phenylobacterium haematophilum TaxID=98513 RepID=A0A839ZW44_9CAUL|nr:TonB-dependent receptor [Phenylobacterium haematophilum]MBB3889422.1 outer membrane receptor protein involved in Fe transport [Phenylobacterium haematophilum]
MKIKSKAALAAVLLTGASAAAMPAVADDAAQVDELIVTARRRAESEQKVATALTVISGDELERRNIETVNDLENSVPNLEVTSQLGGGQPQFRIRGVGMTDYAANNTSTVGVYIDEVAYPYGSMTQGALFDVARIEVLRGPQGILYGRNTTGGAVSVITNAPTKQFDAGINASYGRYNAVHADGFVSGPLTDTLSARLAATVDQGGAWQYHRDTLEELGDKDRWAVRLRLDWQPTEATQIDGSLRYNRDQSDGLGLRLVTRPFQSHNYAPIGRLYPIDTERRITGWGISPYFANLIGVSPNAKPFRDNEGWGANIRLRHDFGWAALTAVAAYETLERREFNDWDATASNEAGTFFFNDIETLSQEVRLVSPAEGAFRWLAGLYHSTETVDGGFYSDFSEASTLRNWMSTSYTQEVQTTGVFGNIDYDLTERLTVSAGLRYEDETRELKDFLTQVLAPVPSRLASTNAEQSMGEWSGKVGLEYKASDDILLFASAARGVKSGGFTTYNSGMPQQLEPFTPETLYAYEAGVKSEFFDRKLRVNLSAFYYDYRDQQLQGILYTQTGRVGRMINIPKSHIWGGELELTWRPTERLTINQSLGYKYGEYDEFYFVNSAATEAARDPVTGQYNTIIYSDRSGERLPFPRADYKGAISYVMDVGPWQFEAETNYNYRSSLFSTTSNSVIGDYWLVNANLTARPIDGRYSIGLWVNNALDSYFEETRNAFISAATASPHPPRTYGVRMSWRY